jgi:thiosulfate/3-mercaptopyruvate sulfurtransferase
VRIEWKELLAADGRFKSVDELRTLFKERGIDEKDTAVTYCQSGGRAALDAFALELAGLPKVKNYYCSWQQWSADESAPVEK